jgi:predicted thioesterase
MYRVESYGTVAPGIEGRTERTVDESLLTRHVGGDGVFATPAMIGLMEITAHDSVAAHLPQGYTTVGYEVHVRHLAPSEPGSRVTVTTRLAQVEGRKLLFEVACLDGGKVVGEGIHRRAIVPARG